MKVLHVISSVSAVYSYFVQLGGQYLWANMPVALCRFPEPALYKRTLTIRCSLISIYEYVVASTLERDIQVTAPFFVARITK